MLAFSLEFGTGTGNATVRICAAEFAEATVSAAEFAAAATFAAVSAAAPFCWSRRVAMGPVAGEDATMAGLTSSSFVGFGISRGGTAIFSSAAAASFAFLTSDSARMAASSDSGRTKNDLMARLDSFPLRTYRHVAPCKPSH